MSKTIRFSFLCIALFFVTSQNSAQIVANAQQLKDKKFGAQKKLKEALTELKDHYHVDILFFDRYVDGYSVAADLIQWNFSIEKNLENVLKATTLDFKKTKKGGFVIAPKRLGQADLPPEKQVDPIPRQSKADPTSTTANDPEVFQSSTTLPPGTILVTGIVSDESGITLPGTSVLEKGTSNGTTADGSGKYSILVQENATLIFSFIGYASTEEVVNSRAKIDVLLKQDTKSLSEVVVVGYGEQRKSDLTGAVVSLNEKQLQGTVATSIDQILQGRAAGVQVTQNSGAPGGGVSIRIRGTNSINGSSEPLYVVDGIPFTGDGIGIQGFATAVGTSGQTNVNALATINPNDIVNVEVLKDASATAIYGSRASNGVVLITTRRGKKGEAKISYDAYYASQSPLKKLHMMNLPQYAEYQNEIGKDQHQTVPQQFLDPSLLGNGTNWQNEVFRTAPMQSHNITVTGGTDKTTYAISGGYLHQDGTIIGSNFSRFSTRVNLESQVKSWFKAGVVASFANTDQKITSNDGLDGVVSQALLATPDVAVRNLDGTYAGPLNTFSATQSNPVALAMLRNNTLNLKRVMTNLYGQAEIIKGLTFRSEIGFDVNQSLNKAFLPTYSYGPTSAIKNDVSQLNQNQQSTFFWIWKNYLTYNKTLGMHNITALAGTEAQRNMYDGVQLQKSNFSSNDIQVLSQGDQTTDKINGNKGASALNSYFGRLNYGFSDRYLVTATLRADGSSQFGPNNRWGYFPSAALAWKVSNENFMKSIPAISNLKVRLGYGQVGNQNVGNFLYGSSLNAQNSAFGTAYYSARFSNPNLKWESTTQYNAGIDMAVLDGRVDFSVDLYHKYITNMLLRLQTPSFLGNTNAGDDIQSPWTNSGKMENKGIDLAVNTRNIVNHKISWNTNFNLSINRNLVTYVDRPYLAGVDYFGNGFGSAARTYTGQPVGSFYGFVSQGLFKNQADIQNHAVQIQDPNTSTPQNYINKRDGVWVGDEKFKDLNGDGVIDGKDATYIGNPNPKFTFGMNNSFSYGGFDLSIFITGSYGGKILNWSRTQIEGVNSYFANQAATVVNRAQYKYASTTEANYDTDPANVTLANPNATIPRFAPNDNNQNGRMSTRFIENGSYLRVQNISLGYTLPQKITQKFNVQRLKLYVNAQKLFTWTHYSGYDPEIGAYNQSALAQNIDRGRYPSPKTFTFGVNLDF